MTTANVPSGSARSDALSATGAALEGLAGVAALTLTLLSFSGLAPAKLTPVAGLLVGASSIVEAAAVIVRARGARRTKAFAGVRIRRSAMAAGVCGAAMMTLASCALAGIAPSMLTALLVTVGGVCLIASCDGVETWDVAHRLVLVGQRVRRRIGAMAAHVLAGFLAVVFGVLGLDPATGGSAASTAGLAVLAAAFAFSGAALSAQPDRD